MIESPGKRVQTLLMNRARNSIEFYIIKWWQRSEINGNWISCSSKIETNKIYNRKQKQLEHISAGKQTYWVTLNQKFPKQYSLKLIEIWKQTRSCVGDFCIENSLRFEWNLIFGDGGAWCFGISRETSLCLLLIRELAAIPLWSGSKNSKKYKT